MRQQLNCPDSSVGRAEDHKGDTKMDYNKLAL